MSKKSEHSARVQKQRVAQPPKGQRDPSGPAASDVTQVDTPPAGSPMRSPRWLSRAAQGLAILVALSCLSGIASLLVPPSVPVPSSMIVSVVPPVEIVNPSLLPIYKIDYACEFVSLQDQSGFSFPPAAAVPNPTKSKSNLYHRQTIPVECVGGMNLGGIRIRSVEFRVSISYLPFGWPFRRHIEYRVTSAFDTQGNFQRWAVE
jgi:hypothetical protein